MSELESFEGWAIVELMGHRRLAGLIAERTIAGQAFLELTVPADQPVTQFYSPSAVYCITPTTEEIARGLAARLRPAPVHRFELEAPKPRDADFGDEDDELYPEGDSPF